MIGRFRAAWDDSRRAANTRRGSNPMSREEWFELQDRIANLVTGESLSIHLSDYRRHIERCIESQFRLHEARTRSDEPLTRRDVEAIAVNAAGDLIGKAFLGSASPDDTRLDAVPQTFIAGAIRTDSPDANARRVTGAIRTDDGDGVVREWNPETYEHTATRRTGVTPILGDGPITRAEATAIGAEIKEKLDELLASKYAHARPDTDKGDDAGRVGHIVATGLDDVFSRVFPKTSTEADDSFPDAPLDKFIAAQNAQTEKYAAEYQEFLGLRRPTAEDDEAKATPIADSPDDQEGLTVWLTPHLVGCAAQIGLVRNANGTTAVAMNGTASFTDDAAQDIVSKLIHHLGKVAELGHSLTVSSPEARARGRLHFSDDERDVRADQKADVPLDRDDLSGPGKDNLSDLRQVRSGDRDLLPGVGNGEVHNSSPSADDVGAHSVGEGSVAGVETAAPVTDATDREALANALQERIAHDEHSLAVLHLSELTLRGSLSTRDAARLVLDEARSKPDVRFERTHYAKCGGTCTVDNLGIRVVEGEIDASGVINSSDLKDQSPTT